VLVVLLSASVRLVPFHQTSGVSCYSTCLDSVLLELVRKSLRVDVVSKCTQVKDGPLWLTFLH